MGGDGGFRVVVVAEVVVVVVVVVVINVTEPSALRLNDYSIRYTR